MPSMPSSSNRTTHHETELLWLYRKTYTCLHEVREFYARDLIQDHFSKILDIDVWQLNHRLVTLYEPQRGQVYADYKVELERWKDYVAAVKKAGVRDNLLFAADCVYGAAMELKLVNRREEAEEWFVHAEDMRSLA